MEGGGIDQRNEGRIRMGKTFLERNCRILSRPRRKGGKRLLLCVDIRYMWAEGRRGGSGRRLREIAPLWREVGEDY